MRYKATVRYDGTAYSGWQKQPADRSIQAELERALRNITQTETPVTGAGRTDSGVHAYGQVFHFDADKVIEDYALAINSQLPADIRVVGCVAVNDDFHARYDAVRKHYRYLINTGLYDPLQRNYVYQYCRPLDTAKMKAAGELFVGTHDFTSFNATKLSEMPNQVRTISSLTLSEQDGIIAIDVWGDGFLKHMVRMIAGTLIQAGQGKLTEADIIRVMASRDKNQLVYNAPANGLTLIEICY